LYDDHDVTSDPQPGQRSPTCAWENVGFLAAGLAIALTVAVLLASVPLAAVAGWLSIPQLYVVSFGIAPSPDAPVLAGVLLGAVGAINPIAGANISTVRQSVTPHDLLGRVTAVANVGARYVAAD
jgi:hypothetical protein